MSHSIKKGRRESHTIANMFKKQRESQKNCISAKNIQLKSSINALSNKPTVKTEKVDDFEPNGEIIDIHSDSSDESDEEKPDFQTLPKKVIKLKSVEYKRTVGSKSTSRLSLKRKHVPDSNCENKVTLKAMTDQDNCSESIKTENDSPKRNDIIEKNNENVSQSCERGEENQIHDQPYYQKNFECIIKSVEGDPDISALLDDSDLAVLKSFYTLSDQGRQIYVRLFGRKFKWIPMSKIKYPEISENLIPYLHHLKTLQLVHDEYSLTALKDVLDVLSAGDIKMLSKIYHIPATFSQKKQIIAELIKLSHRTTVGIMFGSKGGVGSAMVKKAKAMLRGAYKLEKEARSVFIRVMTLFSLVNTTGDEDSGNGGQGQLFQMLMVNMGKVVYPTYQMEKKHRVFKDRKGLIRFERALQLESDLLHCIEKGDWVQAFDVYCNVSKELESLLSDEEFMLWNSNLPDFLRAFSAPSVLYRLLSQGIDILQRRKDYTEAVGLIHKLLDQQLYCCSHRGYWWERLALNFDVHLKKPLEALEAVSSGLNDCHVIGGHRLALYQRAESICERPKLKLRNRMIQFFHSPIRDLPKVYLEGRILHQSMTTLGPRFLTEESYANGNAQEMTVCGVEEFVLEHYKKNGYPRGIHAEGSIVTSLFGLFFWEVLFMPVPDAFHSCYQAQPLDLYSGISFYTTRKPAIDEKLIKIENSSAQVLNEMMEETWTNEFGKLCVGLNWDKLQSLDDMKSLVACIGGAALSGILGRYAKCPRHTRSGFPDLTLWNPETKAWKICEVKGPGDKLSHKQILWLDHLLGLGVDAEVCHVKAVAAKKLRPSV